MIYEKRGRISANVENFRRCGCCDAFSSHQTVLLCLWQIQPTQTAPFCSSFSCRSLGQGFSLGEAVFVTQQGPLIGGQIKRCWLRQRQQIVVTLVSRNVNRLGLIPPAQWESNWNVLDHKIADQSVPDRSMETRQLCFHIQNEAANSRKSNLPKEGLLKALWIYDAP